jgi:hypothetical protein
VAHKIRSKTHHKENSIFMVKSVALTFDFPLFVKTKKPISIAIIIAGICE